MVIVQQTETRNPDCEVEATAQKTFRSTFDLQLLQLLLSYMHFIFWRLPGQLYTVRYRCSTTMRVDCNNLFMLTFHMLACLFLLDQEYLVLSLFRSFFELILTTGLLHQQKQHVFLLFFSGKNTGRKPVFHHTCFH